ncbi:hypothetical protein PoB_007275200 [Plakobranchus ocellatus]|uniref:Uncharacterized protein n=1 Tax=Plakobranchus ocellatus TaxID=259542 RepID=A0AAV4DPG9_9GAST|nr:hypothetical protein PoB_007275200 [Plakobranchus ocellatus]
MKTKRTLASKTTDSLGREEQSIRLFSKQKYIPTRRFENIMVAHGLRVMNENSEMFTDQCTLNQLCGRKKNFPLIDSETAQPVEEEEMYIDSVTTYPGNKDGN